MKISLHILMLFAVFSAAAQEPQQVPVLDALPTSETLGSGWEREISFLVDPLSTPSEINNTAAELPGSLKRKQTDTGETPQRPISGRSHVHFNVRSDQWTNHFEVQMDRFQSKERLIEGFDGLLALDAEKYERTIIEGIGDAAVVFRDRTGITFWFRRGDFRVWASAIGGNRSWEEDPALQHLVKAIDQQINAGVAAGATNRTSSAAQTDP